MSQVHSADIIPFPSRGHADSRPDAPDAPVMADETADPAARLRRALATLDRAVADQIASVARWRGAMGGLDGSVQGLRDSLLGYGARLDELRGQVDAAGDSARRLEGWAEAALAVVSPLPEAAVQPK